MTRVLRATAHSLRTRQWVVAGFSLERRQERVVERRSKLYGWRIVPIRPTLLPFVHSDNPRMLPPSKKSTFHARCFLTGQREIGAVVHSLVLNPQARHRRARGDYTGTHPYGHPHGGRWAGAAAGAVVGSRLSDDACWRFMRSVRRATKLRNTGGIVRRLRRGVWLNRVRGSGQDPSEVAQSPLVISGVALKASWTRLQCLEYYFEP